MALIATYALLSLLAAFLLLAVVSMLQREPTLAKTALIAAGGTILLLVFLPASVSLL